MEIEQKIAAAVASHSDVMNFQLFDVRVEDVLFSRDGNWALATLGFYQPETDTVVPTEPGVALARRLPDGWNVTLQADDGWTAVLDRAPEDLVSPETKRQFTPPTDAEAKAMAKAIGGYKLPWPAGEQKMLTQSVAHSDSMRYAFDFADTVTPMFNLVAARTGVVKYAVWTYPNGYYDGDANHANYLVLEDTSTVPTTYQVYLHLAQNSIPTAFRTPGTRVYRGQFIGIVDDTGYSTGHHVHFQVHTNSSSWWGNSIDITFDDVAINGGRPRLPSEASWYGGTGQIMYTSGNKSGTDFTAPAADLTAPADRSTTALTTVRLSGWVTDTGGSGFSHAYFIADWGEGWQQVGPIFTTSPFSYDWNLCGSDVPVGAVSLSLRAWDRDGNPAGEYPGLRTILHTASCPVPPPACSPSANQVALFSESQFGGDCTVLGTGDYPNASVLAPVGGKNTASVRIGANVMATLYGGNDYTGRSETLTADDPDLSDNRVGSATLVSLRVAARDTTPGNASVLWPPADATVTQGDALVFAWRDSAFSTNYSIEWDTIGPLGRYPLPYIALDGNATGALGNQMWYVLPYSCTDDPDCKSNWLTPTYIVEAAAALPAASTAPFIDTMEGDVSRWRTTGLWRLASSPASSGTHAWAYNRASDQTYDAGTNAGYLTSPPITIPSTGYGLRFRSWADTETTGPHWDQRWVQISVDGGAFVNIFQMTDEGQLQWVQSPRIGLDAYSGHSIRVRFAFFTLDDLRNKNQGWAIDDLAIEASGAPVCSDPLEPNDDPASAATLPAGGSLTGQICPSGDVDYYRFSAVAGNRIVTRLDDLTALAPAMDILAADGSSVLASSTGSSVGYQIPQSGVYFVKVRSQNHPGAGGADHGYSIRLTSDADTPTVAWLDPSTGDYLQPSPTDLSVNAADNGGIQKVEIFRHESDWNSGSWIPVCTDANPNDGWSCPFDPRTIPEGTGLAFFARVSDWVGNQSAAAVWDITNDRTAPDLTVTPLPATQNSTVINLQWSASDAVSGIDHFRIQARIDGGAWATWMDDIPPTTAQAPYAGGAGHSYGFRIAVFDRGGNSTQVELGTTITGCTPDSYEDDDSAAAATPLPLGGSQTHGICGSGDEDWASIQVEAGGTYILSALADGPTAWTILELYDSDGTTRLRQALPPAASLIGQGASLCWTAPSGGTFYVRTLHQDPGAAGDETAYVLTFDTGYCGYLPGILR
jgi:murein DD-endopeptidase MepM/ murein hydrolase activator NlpD